MSAVIYDNLRLDGVISRAAFSLGRSLDYNNTCLIDRYPPH